jgi:ABC-2 type transport system ATP-binding protein
MMQNAELTSLAAMDVIEHNVNPALAVQVHNIVVRVHNRTILNALSLHVPAGVVAGLVGPNGSGKTTTFRLLSGLIGSFTGTANVLGCSLPAQNDRVRTMLGVVPERDGLYDDLRVIDHIDHWARLRFPGNRQHQQVRTEAVLRQMKLCDRRNDRCGTLSAGLRRRVAIARAILHEPPLLLLDEVTNGLDIFSRQDFYEWLVNHKLQHPPSTVIFASHNTAEVARLCNFFIVLRDGQQVYCGPRDQLLSEQASLEEIDGVFMRLLR